MLSKKGFFPPEYGQINFQIGLYLFACEIRQLFPFSINDVVIEDNTNALSQQAVDDRIIEQLLAKSTDFFVVYIYSDHYYIYLSSYNYRVQGE